MDLILPTHESFYSLQHLSTLRNGGFVTDKPKKSPLSSLRNGSSLSLRIRRVTAVSWNQMTADFHSLESETTRLLDLIEKGKLEEGFTFFKNMLDSQGEVPDSACRYLIDRLCRAGKTLMAAQVVDFLKGRNILNIPIYTALIKGLCNAREIDNALKLVRRMHAEEEEEGGCKPDTYIYNILINSMFRQGRFEQAMKLLDEMRSKGCEPNAFICRSVVNWLCKDGRLDEAFEFVTSNNGFRRHVDLYNTVLNGLCIAGRLVDAEKLLADMQCSPSVVTFKILIRTLCQKGLSGRAMKLLESMPRFGCVANPCHYNPVIQSLCKEKRMPEAIHCIEVMRLRGCDPNIATFNTLLAGFWKDGKVDAAIELFNELVSSKTYSPNISTYTIVIEGLSRVGKADQGLEILNAMRRGKGLEPDASTYTRLICGFIREARVEEGMEILDELEELQVEMPPNCYNSIITALCSIEEIDRAIDMLAHMVSKGCKPTQASYAKVIEGLASAGLCKEGMELLNELCLRGALDSGWTKGVRTRIEKICRLD
ncbi:Pentatricopeptide repeat-containing protein At1g09900 [Linum perenne]